MIPFHVSWRAFLIVIVCIHGLAAHSAPPSKPTPGANADLNPSLLNAKTVQVLVTSEDYSVQADDGTWHTLEPYPLTYRVSIARPDKFRVEELVPTSLYVSDGQTQYRYKYEQEARQEAIKQVSGADRIGTAWTSALLKEPMAFVKGQRTGEEIVDGRRMLVYTQPSIAGYFSKIYIEKATHLPYRVSGRHKSDTEQERETNRLDFRSWVFDEPIPARYFAWTPPMTAQALLRPAPAITPLAVGSQAPDFVVYSPDGRAVHLSDYHGKVVVLDFWATWCGPCQIVMPRTAALAKKYADKNVIFLGICTSDKKASFQKWLAQHPEYRAIHFVYDPLQGEASVESSLYHCKQVPVQYILSADGKVAIADVGASVDRTTPTGSKKEIEARYAKFYSDLSQALDDGIQKVLAP